MTPAPISRPSAVERRLAAELPERIRERPRDSRGYPITYVTSVNASGTPDFTVVDGARRAHCIDRDLCGLCGHPLPYWRAVLGGEGVIRQRLSADPPMCEPCASQEPTRWPDALSCSARQHCRPARSAARSPEPTPRCSSTRGRRAGSLPCPARTPPFGRVRPQAARSTCSPASRRGRRSARSAPANSSTSPPNGGSRPRQHGPSQRSLRRPQAGRDDHPAHRLPAARSAWIRPVNCISH